MAEKTIVELEIICQYYAGLWDVLGVELDAFNKANKHKVEVGVVRVGETREIKEVK